MKTLLLISFFYLISPFSQSQITFQKVFGSSGGDYANAVLNTPDGGYLLGGNTLSFGDNFLKNYLIRLNANGDTLWTKIIHSTNWEELNDMANTADGGFILAGRCQAPNFDYDIRLTKLNSDGDVEWMQAIGGSVDEQALSVKQTSDGGYILCGWTNSIGSGQQDIYLIKTDQNGNISWSHVYGGNVDDTGYAVCENQLGGYTIAGTIRSFLPDNDAIIIRTDENGVIIWAKIIGESGDDGFYDVKANGPGYVATGYSNSYSNQYDLTMLNGNADGTINWVKAYNGPGEDRGNKVMITNDNAFIVAGYYTVPGESADMYALKLTPAGDTIWTRTYGGVSDDRALGVALSGDGYVFGGLENSFGIGNGDMYIVKTDMNGTSNCDEHHRTTNIIDITSTFIDIELDTTSGGAGLASNYSITQGGIVNTRCTSVVGVEELSDDSGIRVFPNPMQAADHLMFESPVGVYADILLYDAIGNCIHSKSINVTSGIQSLQLPDRLSVGCYILMIKNGAEMHKTMFVVE